MRAKKIGKRNSNPGEDFLIVFQYNMYLSMGGTIYCLDLLKLIL
jgi:hypothetical protein